MKTKLVGKYKKGGIFRIDLPTGRTATVIVSEVMEIEKRADRIAVNPAIHSLQELRKNTWDVERVDRIINWLKNKFWRE